MWQPAQSRCLNFDEQAQAIKAFSHSLGRQRPMDTAHGHTMAAAY